MPTAPSTAKTKKSELPVAPDYAQLQNRIALAQAGWTKWKLPVKSAGAAQTTTKPESSSLDQRSPTGSAQGFSALPTAASSANGQGSARNGGDEAASGTIQERIDAALAAKAPEGARARSRRELEDERAAELAESLPANAGIGSIPAGSSRQDEEVSSWNGAPGLTAQDEKLRRRLLGRRPKEREGPEKQGKEPIWNGKGKGGPGGGGSKEGVGAKRRGKLATEESESDEEAGRSALGRKKRRQDR